MSHVSFAVVGAGSRGIGYASLLAGLHGKAKVVAVAEPRESHRLAMAQQHGIAQENVFTDWRQLADRPKLADAVIISTQDRMHTEPAVALAAKRYHILLEKPMATTEDQCRRIVAAAKASGAMFAVCHVLRYTPHTRRLKRMLDDGAVGQIVSIQHLEPVGYLHQAHSYVRGNWRNEAQSSSMLLAKSCHDLDWLRYIMGVPCRQISSFGSLKHFRKENKPAEASSRCLDCSLDGRCPYSAVKIYLRDRYDIGKRGWPMDVLTPDVTRENLLQALREGPYGRCVYECDNDVVDNQVVNMLFEGGLTASFTMTAFTDMANRRTRIFGTHGMIESDGSVIRHFDFLSDKRSEVDVAASDASIIGGHGGGDAGLIAAYVDALSNNDPGKILSGPDETLESHLMVFAAERARKASTVETVTV